jgi:hypothetical protein
MAGFHLPITGWFSAPTDSLSRDNSIGTSSAHSKGQKGLRRSIVAESPITAAVFKVVVQ